ncbi:glyco_hydro_56 domain-containing protein [Osmerus mordax]|uniref:glyco_hydro_56 domain-containing protein n=1 Tax=Osmerus mordax TaxID=8014 RepID=UPI0035103C2B
MGREPLLLGLLVLLYIPRPSLGGPSQPALAPLFPGKPFMVFWGFPDTACSGRPDPGAYGMEREGRVTVFYEDSLGHYPYYTDQGQPVNGGLPQHTRLDNHLQKTGEDLAVLLPQVGYQGLGVLRWEEWAPQWSRNQEKQGLYLEESRALLRAFFPDWSPEEVEKWSQVDFEAAAQSILTETLWEVRRLRPKALWGVSPYPDCYNSSPSQSLSNYTGRCPAAEMALNDEMLWLWKRCSALYPSLTLEKLTPNPQARLYVSNQIREAMRVASLAGTAYDIPVFPLVQGVYSSTNTYLSEADLVNTIGESVAMGTAGAIMWDKTPIKTQRACSELAAYVRDVLGPYAVNITTAARLCSVSLCQGRGRCVRRNAESSAYLHLPRPDFLLGLEKAQGVAATGQLSPAGLDRWRRDFRCQWYEALEGAAADEQSPKDGAALGGQSQGQGQRVPPPSPKPLTEPSGGVSPGASVPTPSDHSAPPLSAAILPALLLASALCLVQP